MYILTIYPLAPTELTTEVQIGGQGSVEVQVLCLGAKEGVPGFPKHAEVADCASAVLSRLVVEKLLSSWIRFTVTMNRCSLQVLAYQTMVRMRDSLWFLTFKYR
jgi:hypothetical protein